MGKKSRIVARDTPVQIPKIPAVPLEHVKIKAAFGQPFNLKSSRGHTGPQVTGYRCVAAWTVIHTDDQILEFMEACERLGNVQKLYHGTPATNIESIANQGLRKGYHGMFGGGIYLGGPPKAMGYTKGHSIGAHYLLEVEAALGSIKICNESDSRMSLKRLREEGFDSVGGYAGITASWGGTLRHSEYVVYAPEQVLVNRVFEYQSLGAVTPRDIKTESPCELVITKEVDLSAKQRAFKDVISQQVCGNKAYTSVTVVCDKVTFKDKVVWLCKPCVDRHKLRFGSKITIRWGYGRSLRNLVVSIK